MGAIYMVLGLAVMVPMVFLTEELLTFLSVSAQTSEREVQAGVVPVLMKELMAGMPLGALGGILEKQESAAPPPPVPEKDGEGDEAEAEPPSEATAETPGEGSEKPEEACKKAWEQDKIGEFPSAVDGVRFLWLPSFPQRAGTTETRQPGLLIRFGDVGLPFVPLPSPFSTSSKDGCKGFTKLSYDTTKVGYCYVPDLKLLEPRTMSQDNANSEDIRCYGSSAASWAAVKDELKK